MEGLAIVIGYLFGSIPFAYIAGRLIKGVDIRQVGGGNVGAVNTLREVGTKAGIGVLVADIAKGAAAVLIAQWLGLSLIFVYIVGFAAVVGHNWPVFLKFRGGMGAATTIGVLFALVPIASVIGFAIMVIVVFATSNMRLAMAFGFISLPLLIWGFGGAGNLIAYSLALPAFCGLRSIPSLKADLTAGDGRKSMFFDRQYKPWQRRRG